MSAKRSKTAQRLDAIVSNPKTISDVMIAIDRLRYHLERIEETSTTIQVNAAPTSEQPSLGWVLGDQSSFACLCAHTIQTAKAFGCDRLNAICFSPIQTFCPHNS